MPDTESTEGRGAWIGSLIRASAREPGIVLVVLSLLCLGGLWAWNGTPLDALPDLSPTQVIVRMEWPEQSPDRVEDQITFPLSTALLATPGLETVRGQSHFGSAFVYAIFEDGTDPEVARARVAERLATVSLPAGVSGGLGPAASGVGWVLQYALLAEPGGPSLASLREHQEVVLKPALSGISGVAEVASLGGFEREIQVELDPARLIAHGVAPEEIAMAIRRADAETGGGALELAGHEVMVRGRGALRGTEDLAAVAVRGGAGGALRLGEIARISEGPAARRGIADLNGAGEVVGGIVVARTGADVLTVIDAAKARLDELSAGLPAGTRVELVYDRSTLIRGAVRTQSWALFQEALVLLVVVGLGLRHARSGLLVLLSLPVAGLLAFLGLRLLGISTNILSLGGMAVAFGAMVDGGIVLVENVHRRGAVGDRQRAMVAAMAEVGPSIFFSLLVITVSFLPVFLLEGPEGRLFRPLALTKTLVMGAGALLSLTLIPALGGLLLRGNLRSETDDPLHNRLSRWYAPAVRWTVDHPRRVVGAATGTVLLSLPLWFGLEREFAPPLEEGDLLYMPASPPGMGSSEAAKLLQISDRALAAVPEVESVFGKAGRAESATDPAPLSMFETTIQLKPRSAWREGMTAEKLRAELAEKVEIPGMPDLFWGPIETRTEMLTTGVRSPLALRLYGSDPGQIAAAGLAVEASLRAVPGLGSVFAERDNGGFYLDIALDRERASALGVDAMGFEQAVGLSIGGMRVGQIREGRKTTPIRLGYAREWRDTPEKLGRVLVPAHSGVLVQLSDVAQIGHVQGPHMLASERGLPVSHVFIDPGSLSVGEAYRRAQGAVAALHLPGVHGEWTGQIEHLKRMEKRLLLVVPVTLLLVVLLLYLNTRSWVETGIVLLAVPFSLVGAVLLVGLLGHHLSIAVWVGMIALAGLDAETGVVMLLYLRLSVDRAAAEGRLGDRAALREAIVEGAAHRLRPKLLTVVCSMTGLLPILWSEGPGADLMKRVAAPMVGGLATSFVLELLVYPAVYGVWRGRGLQGPAEAQDRNGEDAEGTPKTGNRTLIEHERIGQGGE